MKTLSDARTGVGLTPQSRVVQWRRLAAGVAVGLAAAGCVTSAAARTNVGMVDYAYVSPSEPCALAKDKTACETARSKHPDCVKLEPGSKYALPGEARKTLVRPGDIYEVDLFPVKMESFKADLFSKKGEFAIVARAYEMAATPESAPMGLDFRPEASAGGRVIYYSDDIRQRQTLNYGMLPMFGPVKYFGNPVGVSLFLIEVDSAKDNAKMSALLSTLAGLGRTVSVPATPAFDLLESLGTALINGNKDDVLMRYDTTLRSARNARPELRSAFFRYGDYILIRSEVRDVPIDWSNLHYKLTDKRVYYDAACTLESLKDSKEERRLGYGVVQVNRAKAAAYVKTVSFGQLREAIDKYEQGDLAAIETAAESIKGIVSGANQYRRLVDAIGALDAEDESKKPDEKLLGNLEERLKAPELLDSIAAMTDPASPKKAVFKRDQVEEIMERLRDLTQSGGVNIDTFDVPAVMALVRGRFGK